MAERAFQTSEDVHFLFGNDEWLQIDDPLDALGERRSSEPAVVANELGALWNQVADVESVVLEDVLFVELGKGRESLQNRRKRAFSISLRFFQENTDDGASILMVERFADRTILRIPVDKVSFSLDGFSVYEMLGAFSSRFFGVLK